LSGISLACEIRPMQAKVGEDSIPLAEQVFLAGAGL
jgi:hypothetical protein